MKYYLNERPVEIIETDYDDGFVMVCEAVYLDGAGETLDDNELNELQDAYQDGLAQDAYESAVDAAHDYYSGDR